MSDPTPKRPPGRPKQNAEAKVNTTHRMTPKAHEWIRQNKEKIEEMARQ